MKYHNIVDILLQEAVIKAVEHYGIEGTELKIKEVYNTPGSKVIKEKMLATLHKMYNFG